jgi:hypothetical protein
MHGGAPGSGAQPGNRNARKHGFYGAEAEAERRRLRELLKLCEKTLEMMGRAKGADVSARKRMLSPHNRSDRH